MVRRKFIKRFLLIFFISLIGLITIAAILFFAFRNTLLQNKLQSYSESFQKKYGAELIVKDARFTSFSTVAFSGITILPPNKDTLLKLDSVAAELSLWNMIFQKTDIDNLKISNAFINMRADSISDNYSFLLHKKSDGETKAKGPVSKMNKLLDLLFSVFPEKLEIWNLKLKADIHKYPFLAELSNLRISNDSFTSPLLISDSGIVSHADFGFELDRDNRYFKISVASKDSQRVRLPFLRNLFNARFDFKQASFSIKDSGNYWYAGEASLHDSRIHHEKFSLDTIILNDALFNYKIKASDQAVEIDSSSALSVNGFRSNPYFFIRAFPYREYAFVINRDNIPSQQFFNALPPGLFTKLIGIKTQGLMSLHVDFHVDFRQIDSLRFKFELKKGKGFGVVHYGKANLEAVNKPFNHTSYYQDEPMTTFIVGEKNPDFRLLEDIPAYLTFAIVNSENGGFFADHGFDSRAFRESMILNLKEKRFVRGGSTLSMQFVKNVFLTKNKTIARKIEEILMVWLITENKLIEKERMMEIYLNIIEWGPGIYGCNQAAQFYFGKDVKNITLPEALYLACIIPRPRSYRSYIYPDGRVREYVYAYFDVISKILYKKDIITLNELENLKPDIQFTPLSLKLMKMKSEDLMDSIVCERTGKERGKFKKVRKVVKKVKN
ncbi:MAG: biosynthetic peptidoglycan transglycosylase [Bacteroidota bacterium]